MWLLETPVANPTSILFSSCISGETNNSISKVGWGHIILVKFIGGYNMNLVHLLNVSGTRQYAMIA